MQRKDFYPIEVIPLQFQNLKKATIFNAFDMGKAIKGTIKVDESRSIRKSCSADQLIVIHN